MSDFKPNFRLLKSSILFKGKVFDLKVDELEYESGNPAVREVAVHPGGAVVVALTEKNNILLVKQFRYPLQKFLLELPAGKLDPDEFPDVCALRELKEETGYTAKNLTKLGAIITTPGFCTEELHIYLATGLQKGDHSREEGEAGMEMFEYSIEEVDQLIIKGDITDAKTICGIYLVKNYLNKI